MVIAVKFVLLRQSWLSIATSVRPYCLTPCMSLQRDQPMLTTYAPISPRRHKSTTANRQRPNTFRIPRSRTASRSELLKHAQDRTWITSANLLLRGSKSRGSRGSRQPANGHSSETPAARKPPEPPDLCNHRSNPTKTLSRTPREPEDKSLGNRAHDFPGAPSRADRKIPGTNISSC